MIEKMFKVPIYNFRVYVTDYQHTQQVEELTGEGRELGGVVYWYKGKLCVYVAPDTKGRFGEFVAHESVHCAYAILKTVGVTVDADNHEALTYLTSYIYSNIERIMQKEVLKVVKGRLM